MSIETELRVNRRNTAAFIAARPTLVVLERTVRTKVASGGYSDDTSELKDAQGNPKAQVFRIIAQSSASGYSPTTDGTARNVEFILLGNWDADVQVDDLFQHDGRTMRVRDLIEDNGYERRAVVVQKGKKA